MLHGFAKEEMLNNSKDKQGEITMLFSEGVMLIQEIVINHSILREIYKDIK